MPNIEDLKTDAQIASILKKLKDAKPADKSEDISTPVENQAVDRVLQVPVSDVEIQSRSNTVSSKEVEDDLEMLFDNGLLEEDILPWFSMSDRDLDSFHYAKFGSDGNIQYASLTSNRPNEIASVKLKPDFACDIDYYKSNHYVLFVKQLDSDYSYSRSFTPCDESRNIVVEDTKFISDDNITTESDNSLELAKASSDDLTTKVADSDKYCHFVVFTDGGIADFIARQDDVTYPYSASDLNKWFEETSNFVQLKNANFDRNPLLIQDDALNIQDFTYDIITIRRPGIITLDSIDNQDSSYQVHLKLKDEYTFLPLNRILGCLKHYAKSDLSIDDLRRFISRYFNILV